MNRLPRLLSKTKLMRGYRCLKAIYLTIHQPSAEAPITPELQALFDQGNAVGMAARTYFPGGVLIDNVPWDFTGTLAKTREAMANGATIIYEAAFEHMGCYARADIIVLSPETNRWRIYEVKSTTKVKPEHLEDVGLQTWIMAKCDVLIEQVNIMHLNPACRYPDLSNLFCTEDVTQQMREQYITVKPKLHEIFSVIATPNTPDIDIGEQCLKPTECGFKAHCWQAKKIPDFSIFNLPGIHSRKWELYQAGIINVDDPRLTDLDELQERIIHCYKTHERYVDKAGIQAAIADWQFPLVFLDFETINPAIPRYDDTKPFQHVPFQFSVHVWESFDGEITHDEFLHTAADDPRPDLIPALIEACGEKGTILAYYAKFEIERIKELIAYAPQYQVALEKLLERIVDPLPLFRACVYDNGFMGSYSLKKVAPALLGESATYQDMLVGDGGAAQRAFEELIAEKTTAQRKVLLQQAMLDYCKQDTEVMVGLVKWLYLL